MAWGQSSALWKNNNFIVGDGDARAEGRVAPAEADHVVIFGPVKECIVGGMKDDEAAAIADIVDECAFYLRRPAEAGRRVAAVEIVDDHVVLREIRKGWIGGDIDLGKVPVAFEDFLDGGGSGRPVVIIDAVDNYGFPKMRGGPKRKGREDG